MIYLSCIFAFLTCTWSAESGVNCTTLYMVLWCHWSFFVRPLSFILLFIHHHHSHSIANVFNDCPDQVLRMSVEWFSEWICHWIDFIIFTPKGWIELQTEPSLHLHETCRRVPVLFCPCQILLSTFVSFDESNRIISLFWLLLPALIISYTF